jgi:hypothetical protein
LNDYNPDWRRRLKKFTIDLTHTEATEDSFFSLNYCTNFNPKNFKKLFHPQDFEKLESLEIRKMKIVTHWEEIINVIPLIPSESFRKFIIVTSNLNQAQLYYLIATLKLVKQKISVELRCKSIKLLLESSESD